MKAMTMPQIQQALMCLSPENQERFYKERDEFLANTPFEFPFPENFDHYRFFIGCHTNEITLGITAVTYCNLFFNKTIENYSIGNMMSICQGSESVTFFMYVSSFGKKEGVNPVAEWTYMRKSFEELTAKINDIIEPAIQKMLKRILNVQQSLITNNVGQHDIGSYKKNGKLS